MPPRRIEDDRPVMGERVEVYDYADKNFSVHEIKRVMHKGMRGWTVETSMGLFIEVEPVNAGANKPSWREIVKDG